MVIQVQLERENDPRGHQADQQTGEVGIRRRVPSPSESLWRRVVSSVCPFNARCDTQHNSVPWKHRRQPFCLPKTGESTARAQRPWHHTSRIVSSTGSRYRRSTETSRRSAECYILPPRFFLIVGCVRRSAFGRHGKTTVGPNRDSQRQRSGVSPRSSRQ